VVREYARLTPSPRVNRHLSLGTPHRGAELAWNVGSGNLLWWAGDIGYRILDPVWTYRGADPDWQWLWFDYGSALYLESAAWLIWEGLTEVLPAGLEILGLPTSWFPYVLEDMPPFSETFYYLNHSSTLAQEAQRIPIARVSISTQYMPELAPWRAAAAATGGGSFDALYLWYVQQDLINLAWDAYYYYWFHPNWELSSNAYKWQDMAWALMTIQADWQVFIAVNLYGWHWTQTGRRRFREAYIEVPRKNGKTLFMAALGRHVPGNLARIRKIVVSICFY